MLNDFKKKEELLIKIKNEQVPTFELQRQFVDMISPDSMYTILEEKLLDETIEYMIKKDPNFLRILPKKKITYNRCLEAVKNIKGSPGILIRSIPRIFFDYNLCKEILFKNNKLIRKIPIELITEDFINNLMLCGIKFVGNEKYIDECIKLNKKSKEDLQPNNDNNLIENDKYNELENINLASLTDVFLSENINTLKSIDIVTLKQLFMAYDSGILGTLINDTSKQYFKILNTTKLLKCKYLDIDPMIDENSEECIKDIMISMGISNRAIKAILRYEGNDYSVSEFFRNIRANNAYERFSSITLLGETSVKEIVSLGRIVVSYHDKHKNDILNNIEETLEEDKESLTLLNKELNSLIEERNRLDKEINCILVKMQSKLNKGGTLK